MPLADELARAFPDNFRVLILDNEVTVGAFVRAPAWPWARLVAAAGGYRVADGYPARLDAAEAEREKLNWDVVSEAAIRAALAGLEEAADGTPDLIAFGNNAGQGLALAPALPAALRAARGIVIYGRSLPERAAYAAAGYGRFCARDELTALIDKAAAEARRAPALAFINTIEHNERNYHAPWRG